MIAIVNGRRQGQPVRQREEKGQCTSIISVHNVFLKVTFHAWLCTSCENMVSHRKQIMDNTRTCQMVYAGPTNICQHSTTDLARGIMTNERKQSVASKARSFKHYKQLVCIQCVTKE